MSGPTKPIPTRFGEETMARLKTASRRMGSSNSAVIRLAVLQLLPQLEAGTLTLQIEHATATQPEK